MATYSITLSESAHATDSLTEHTSQFVWSLHEAAHATDSLRVQRLPNLDITNQPYPVLSLNVPNSTNGMRPWLVQAANHINSIRGGAHNTTTSVTLNSNSGTTTLTDARISAQSHISLSPLTQSAAKETWWISAQTKGSATISHSDNPDTTRTFRANIVA